MNIGDGALVVTNDEMSLTEVIDHIRKSMNCSEVEAKKELAIAIESGRLPLPPEHKKIALRYLRPQ